MKKFDVVHAEQYTSGGEERTRWINCGAILTTKKGGFVMKLDSIPVRSDGWFQLFEPKEKEAPPPPQDDGPNDDIPFN